MITSHVIERDGVRTLVLNLRGGGFSLTLDEGLEALNCITSSLCQAYSSNPIPDAPPRRHFEPPILNKVRPRQTITLADLGL